MKRAVLLVIIVVGSVAVWRLGSRLSADAVGLAVGVLLGVLASIPASLLILASSRRGAEAAADARWTAPQQERNAPIYQPPVIVLAGQGVLPPAQQLSAPTHPSAQPLAHPPAQPIHGWPQSNAARQFKIVGEEERWLG